MEHKITLRKYPYPFRCAIAICSDVDATPSLERFLELQKFLCTSEQTSSGQGLSLEIGNSFWFFRNSDHPGISYFDRLSTRQTEFAPFCRALIRSGLLDVLHSYGDFNNGGFLRKYAELSINELLKENLNVKTWVNHGNNFNSQNIGSLPYYYGAKKASEYYHIDLLKQIGLKYFWISQITHLVGQNSLNTPTNIFKNQLQKILAIKYYGRQINPFFSNQLMKSIILEDGSEINAFMRFINPWGKYSYTNAENFSKQLSRKVVDELKYNEGYLILYTHLGNYSNTNQILPEDTCRTLRYLSKEHLDGNIFITTTTRLLNYYEVSQNINFNVDQKANAISIYLNFKKNCNCNEQDLGGLTFNTDYPEKTEIFFNGNQLKKNINPFDYNGNRSVSIPWQKLEFPSEIL